MPHCTPSISSSPPRRPSAGSPPARQSQPWSVNQARLTYFTGETVELDFTTTTTDPVCGTPTAGSVPVGKVQPADRDQSGSIGSDTVNQQQKGAGRQEAASTPSLPEAAHPPAPHPSTIHPQEVDEEAIAPRPQPLNNTFQQKLITLGRTMVGFLGTVLGWLYIIFSKITGWHVHAVIVNGRPTWNFQVVGRNGQAIMTITGMATVVSWISSVRQLSPEQKCASSGDKTDPSTQATPDTQKRSLAKHWDGAKAKVKELVAPFQPYLRPFKELSNQFATDDKIVKWRENH